MTEVRRPASGGLLAVGETMAMLAPASGGRLADAELFRLDAGGAESNVAAHVAALGHPAGWFSRLGEDAFGRRILRQLARRGIDVSAVELDPAYPTGLYVKDPGNGVRYYRSGSAAAHLDARRVGRGLGPGHDVGQPGGDVESGGLGLAVAQ